MFDIFVSYARSTEPQAKEIAEALRAEGFSVWRDDEIPAHKPYAEVIEERLRSSKAVLVIWSADAAKSQWVRAEADAARELGTLIQVTIDGTLPPLPFNQIQCARVECSARGVMGNGWDKLTSSVAALVDTKRGISTDEKPLQRRSKSTICVLPFVNMSGDLEQEYFSDGISEDITTDLSKVSALDVVARNTAFTLKGQSLDLCEVARRLGVSHVLEGSVRKAGSRVRISAQLIDGNSGSHVWAERYDRELTDIFAIQDEISKAIVEALKVKLLPGEKKAIEQRGTTNADAYNLYLMARNYWVSGNYGDMQREQRVIRLCRRCVEIDPDYAHAWALLALAQVSLRFYCGLVDGQPAEAAERAIAIDPTIAEAYAVRGRLLAEGGQFEEANREIARAVELGPESWEVNREAARVAMTQSDIQQAAHFYRKAVNIIDSDYHSWAMLAMCYQALGQRDALREGAERMLSESAKVLAEDPSNGAALGIQAGGHAILGNRDQAIETIERALLINPENLNMRYNFACILSAYLEEHEASLDMLEPVFANSNGAWLVTAAAIDPDLAPLHDNPRFRIMLGAAQKRLGIQPHS